MIFRTDAGLVGARPGPGAPARRHLAFDTIAVHELRATGRRARRPCTSRSASTPPSASYVVHVPVAPVVRELPGHRRLAVAILGVRRRRPCRPCRSPRPTSLPSTNFLNAPSSLPRFQSRRAIGTPSAVHSFHVPCLTPPRSGPRRRPSSRGVSSWYTPSCRLDRGASFVATCGSARTSASCRCRP